MYLTSDYIEEKTLRVRYGDQFLFDYIYRPDTNKQYCPRPYFHPIRTLAGDILTNNRPADHPWHQGLSLTMSSVNGMNFWGGHTYSKESGEYANIDNIGTQLHRDWVEEKAIENGYAWTESLDWIGPQGQKVFTETRTLTVRDIDPEVGLWRLVWESELTNTLGETISHNSYSSGEGLQGSGYTGLFLRMSRGFDNTGVHIFDGKQIPKWDDYHDGETILDSPDQLNGWNGSRLAYQGIFDTSLNGCLILCEDLTENPPYTHYWFCRPQFPCLAWSTAHHDTHTIGIGETFKLKHSLGIVNGFWTKDQAQSLWMGT